MSKFLRSCLLLAVVSSSLAQDLGQLRQDLKAGGVAAVFPDDASYSNVTKPFNSRFTVRPVAVTFPTSTEQVSTAIKVGVKQSLRVVARSGGHSYVANSLGGKDGALVVDLSKMVKVAYNDNTGIATIEPGNRLGDVAVGLNAHGRGLPHGRCNSVGLGGHAGYGGWGFASRMWGMTLDNIQAATVVLANGTIVTASKSSHADLFWGIRGASGSFGIVTSYDFQTHAIPTAATGFSYSWNLDVNASIAMLEQYQKFSLSSSLPDNIGFDIFLNPSFTSGKGTLKIDLLGEFYGPVADFNKTMAPFLGAIPTPTTKKITSGTWLQALEAVELGPLDSSTAPPSRDNFYAKSLMIPQSTPMTSEAISALIKFCANNASGFNGFWHVEVELYGGSKSAINAVSRNETAFAHRDTLFTLQIYVTSWSSPPFPDAAFKLIENMTAAVVDNMPKGWIYGAYPNYMDDRLQNWQTMYYGDNYPRLQSLKKAIDPTDVFNFPLTIEE